TYHPADIESPGFTGGYSQLVLSGQAATLKHSNLIRSESYHKYRHILSIKVLQNKSFISSSV
ncbi:hypothetical protein AALM74_24640, partial [Parabacteroides segnis]|uniref:hypothetical protein n=1 Tax=Parabacteroides segnis TaxID=2763058 RepID=UPI003515EDA7